MSADLAEELSKQTRDLVSRFEVRADSFRGRDDLSRIMVPVDAPGATGFAREFLGEGEHLATGIDGSMDYDERLQMILFYSNATAYSCPFTVGSQLSFDLDSARRDVKLAASAAVPLWAEDLASVFSHEPEIDIELEHSMERIPNSFMTLGEMYLAVQASAKSKVIFLDRPLSGTFSTLSRDARNLLKRGGSKLTEWEPSSPVSLMDIELAVNLGSPAMAVPSRGRFLTWAVVKKLMQGPMTIGDLASELKVGEPDIRRAAKAIAQFDSKHHGALLADHGQAMKLDPGVARYWDRVSALSLSYARDAFGGKRHPLALDGEQYLTILDVNAVALFLLCLLYQKARENRTLLTGVAKDTTATDISRAVLPFASSSGFLRLSAPPPRLKNDRAFLAILSSENPSIRTPWRTVSYDSAYSTIVSIGGKLVSARKVVSRERLFARSFFQLRTLRTDQSVRSQVFLFDRLFDEEFDSPGIRSFEVEERSGPTTVAAYFEGDEGSALSNLILHVLSLNDNPEVFEAFGHNQLLYLADKAVKAEVRMLRSSLRGVADLRLGGVSRRRKIFGLATPYRQQREEAEHARMRQ